MLRSTVDDVFPAKATHSVPTFARGLCHQAVCACLCITCRGLCCEPRAYGATAAYALKRLHRLCIIRGVRACWCVRGVGHRHGCSIRSVPRLVALVTLVCLLQVYGISGPSA